MNKKVCIKKGILKCVAAIAKKTAELSAGSACMWWDYQPKMPKAVKKMRKF